MTILFFIGLALCILGSVGMLIAAFRSSLLWGLGCLLIPGFGLIYVLTHWSEARNAFLLGVFGLVLMLIGGTWDTFRETTTAHLAPWAGSHPTVALDGTCAGHRVGSRDQA